MTEIVADAGLAHFVSDWRPAPVVADDVIGLERVEQWASTLDLDERFSIGDALPPLWQWAYFLDWRPTAALGEDGHPRDGHFLPPIPHRRRMFAGGRMTVESPLRIGAPVSRRSEIAAVTAKHGRTGELLFVTVRHTYSQDGSVRIAEEQDLVYRSDTGTSTAHARVSDALAPATAPWSETPVPDAVLLFRFSALTGNAHRIHYDEAYTTATEGYPGLVVHGPLLAVYMAELLRANVTGGMVREFRFRLQRPVFLGDPIRVEGRPVDADIVELAVVSGSSTVHASATAVLA